MIGVDAEKKAAEIGLLPSWADEQKAKADIEQDVASRSTLGPVNLKRHKAR